jgi:phosphoribosylglycinamide formyltransferase-1
MGITPRYRGVHGGYWALAEGNRDLCGVTVHRVDAGIDTGPIVEQIRVMPANEDNFVTYPYLQLAMALPMLQRAVETALRGELQCRPAGGQSQLYFHPSIGEYLWNRLRRGVR